MAADTPLKGRTVTGQLVELDPRLDFTQRGLLVGIPHEPLPWNASWVNGQLSQMSRLFNVAIRIVPVCGLRGK